MMDKILIVFLCCLPTLGYAGMTSEQNQATQAVIEHLLNDYVEPDVGQSTASSLQLAAKRGELDNLVEEEFAKKFSQLLQQFSGDGHLNLEYSSKIIEPKTEASYSAEQMEKWYGAHINYGVQQAARLAGNVGLLDLRVFSPLEMGGDTVVAAMNMIAATDALIIDLRLNGGGIGATSDLVASYLFDKGSQPLAGNYDRPSNTTTQRYTQDYVPGKRFGEHKPVYVLISNKTFSAAEALAYNLQALDRAIIVGEVSGGGAHPFEYLPVTDHYVLWSVTAKSIHPITQSNWQGVGVQPDIEVSAEDALDAALDAIRATQANAD